MDIAEQGLLRRDIAELRRLAAASRADGRRPDLSEAERKLSVQKADTLNGEADGLEKKLLD